jgi:hypothetical protein
LGIKVGEAKGNLEEFRGELEESIFICLFLRAK